MKEQFVTYEITIKLKEKGFDEPCFGLYNIYETYGQYGIINIGDLHLTNVNRGFKGNNAIIAPLWQQVIDWFREKHQIEIVLSGITVYDIRQYHICLYYNVDGIMTDHAMLLFDEETREYTGYQTFTYPEARQTAIEHALTLI